MLASAVMMALPVTLALLLVQVLAGMLSRSAPTLNLFSLGLPASILGGLAALLATAPMIGDRIVDLSQRRSPRPPSDGRLMPWPRPPARKPSTQPKSA
jgi:flagellar biosynthesis protein FliR